MQDFEFTCDECEQVAVRQGSDMWEALDVLVDKEGWISQDDGLFCQQCHVDFIESL
jgi:hypothetical protein